MSRVFMTGLESGSITIFDDYSGAALTSTPANVRTGDYALEIDGNDWAFHQVESPPQDIYIRAYVYISGSISDSSEILGIQDDIGNKHIHITKDGDVDYWDGAAWSNLGNASAMPTGSYFRLEIYVDISQSDVYPDGKVTVKYDGVINLALTDVMTWGQDFGTDPTVGRVTFGNMFGTSIAGDVYYDDIAINDTYNGVNDSWPGEGGIYWIRPNGPGSSEQFYPFPGAGEHNYEDVDEVPPDDDTTYVQADDVLDKDLYDMEDLSVHGISSMAIVKAVAFEIYGKTPMPGVTELTPLFDHNGVFEEELPNITLSDTNYKCVQHIEDENPVLDSVWTAEDINNSRFGFREGS